jgi:hypothetical protein
MHLLTVAEASIIIKFRFGVYPRKNLAGNCYIGLRRVDERLAMNMDQVLEGRGLGGREVRERERERERYKIEYVMKK